MTEKLQTEREILPLWDRAAFKDPFGSSYIIKSQKKKETISEIHIFILVQVIENATNYSWLQ